MRNLYNAIPLTTEQKVAYIRVLTYLAKSDKNPEFIEKDFIKVLLDRMDLSPDVLKKIYVPRNSQELYRALMPICTRPIAIDLLHCLWFAASFNSIISDDEIMVIRKIAQILRIDNDTLLNIHNFVSDEIMFLQHAREVLEAEELRC
ncbi:MAG: hypothetical protein Q4D80_04570 [Pseudomonadota bacterium]|nr:hypothetical protein [Pseudomonadota bacterium]